MRHIPFYPGAKAKWTAYGKHFYGTPDKWTRLYHWGGFPSRHRVPLFR